MTKRLFVGTALKEKWSAATLRSKLGLEVSVRTIQRYLQDAEFLEYRSLKTAPTLSAEHKRKILIWARESVRMDASFWRRVCFTDEKRWCLDGPDGTLSYWSDRRIPADIFSKRVRGGGGLMVWAGTSYRAKTPLYFCASKVDAAAYTAMLDEVYQPWVEEYYPNGNIFQQDGAPSHTALHTKKYFASEAMDVLPWPAKSPDQNCIENIWGILVRRVYQGYRYFDDL